MQEAQRHCYAKEKNVHAVQLRRKVWCHEELLPGHKKNSFKKDIDIIHLPG